MSKMLPNGCVSALSLNQYQITQALPLSANIWYARKGEEAWSNASLRTQLLAYIPGLQSVKNLDVVRFIRHCDGDMQWIQEAIIQNTAEGLAALLYSLHNERTNPMKNPNLTDGDRLFWSQCRDVFFVGGLAYGQIGNKLEATINRLLLNNSCDTMKAICVSDQKAEELSLRGCASLFHTTKRRVYAFDFGNTARKQGIVRIENGEYILESLDLTVQKIGWDLQDTLVGANELHSYILYSILDAIACDRNDDGQSLSIGICIANNTHLGRIANRGAYRSLRHLSEDYAAFLTKSLSSHTKRRCEVRFVNDAFAIANMFHAWAPTAAVVTLGTYMGIAYPLEKANCGEWEVDQTMLGTIESSKI